MIASTTALFFKTSVLKRSTGDLSQIPHRVIIESRKFSLEPNQPSSFRRWCLGVALLPEIPARKCDTICRSVEEIQLRAQTSDILKRLDQVIWPQSSLREPSRHTGDLLGFRASVARDEGWTIRPTGPQYYEKTQRCSCRKEPLSDEPCRNRSYPTYKESYESPRGSTLWSIRVLFLANKNLL